MKKIILSTLTIFALILGMLLPVTNASATTIVSTLKLELNLDELFNYVEGVPENEVNTLITSLVGCDSSEAGYYIDGFNSGLAYIKPDGVVYGVTGDNNMITVDKNYYLCFCVTMNDGYQLADRADRVIYFNGKETEAVYGDFEADWGAYVYIKLDAPAAMENHTHNYVYQKNDDSHHWKECTCGMTDAYAEHSYQWIIDKEPTESENGSRHKECLGCGFALEAEELPSYGVGEQPTTISNSTNEKESSTDAPQGGTFSIWFVVVPVSIVVCASIVVAIIIIIKKKKN